MELIKVVKLSGTRNGYYRSHETMERPYVAILPNNLYLENSKGRPRRFSTASAARAAAELATKMVQS